MTEQNQNQPIPPQIIDLLINDLFRKNGVNIDEAKNKLSSEQKQMIKELVNDLKKQVDAFVKPSQKNSQ